MEGVGFALARARIPDVSRRRFGDTDLRGRGPGRGHGLSRRTGEIVNQRAQLRVGRIEHESRADGVEGVLWSSGYPLTTGGGAKGHELLPVCARPLDAARGRRLGGAHGLRGSVVAAQATPLRPPAAAVRSRPWIVSAASREGRWPPAARRPPPLTPPQRADAVSESRGRPQPGVDARLPIARDRPPSRAGTAAGTRPRRGRHVLAGNRFGVGIDRDTEGLDDAGVGVDQPCPHGLELLPQLFHVGVPIRRLLGHRPFDDVRQLRIDVLHDGFDGWRRPVEQPDEHTFLHGPGERALVRQQLVSEHPDRIDVGALVHHGTGDLFGRHVVQRPDHLAGVGQARLPGVGDAEVEDLHRAGGVFDHDVRRLDVTMDDARLVGAAQRIAHFLEDGELFEDRHGRAPVDHGGQRLSRDVLHRDERPVAVFTGVEDGDDVGVVEPAGGADFAREALPHGLVLEALAEQLDRDEAVDGGVPREIEGSHPPMRELTRNQVPPNDSGDLGHRRSGNYTVRARAPRLSSRLAPSGPFTESELMPFAPAGSPGSERERLRPQGPLEQRLLGHQRLPLEEAETAVPVDDPELAAPLLFAPHDAFAVLVSRPGVVPPLGSHPAGVTASPLPYAAWRFSWAIPRNRPAFVCSWTANLHGFPPCSRYPSRVSMYRIV